MKKILKRFTPFVFLVIFMTSCSLDSDSIETTDNFIPKIDISLSQQTDWNMALEILYLINSHRQTMGLSSIQVDNQLASAYAVSHTQYMIEMNEINHANFQIRSKGMIDAGAIYVGENVASGYNSPEGVVNAWLNSPSHKNIIEGNYTHSGFGILKNDQGKYYFTQLFYKMQ